MDEWLSQVYAAVWKKMDALAQEIAAQMAALPWPESKTSPEDGPASTLRNSWEEFACELQDGPSWASEAFEDQVRLFARGHIDGLDWQEAALLWAITSAAINHDDCEPLHRAQMVEPVEDELWERTCELARHADISHFFDYVDPDTVEDDEEEGEEEASEPEAGGQRTLF